MPRRRLQLLCLLLLARCGAAANMTYDLRWVGTVTPQDQTSCGPPTQGTLTRRARDLQLHPQ